MTDYQRWMKKVFKEAARQGWDASDAGKHIKFKSPDGARIVSCSKSPTNGFQVRLSVVRDLRRAGFDVAHVTRA